MLGQGDLANLTVDIITPRHTGCGDTPEEKGQEALDNDFHMRQGKAEAIQDYIKREEMMPLSLQNSTKRKRSEASESSQKEARGLCCCEEGNPADNRCQTERGSS